MAWTLSGTDGTIVTADGADANLVDVLEAIITAGRSTATFLEAGYYEISEPLQFDAGSGGSLDAGGVRLLLSNTGQLQFGLGMTVLQTSGPFQIEFDADSGSTGGAITFPAAGLVTDVFNNVRCRLSLVPGGPVAIADSGDITNGGIEFTTTDVDVDNDTITLSGIAGKLNSNTVIRFYGTDVPEGIDTRAVYYPARNYAGDNILVISTSPGGTALDLSDGGSGTMHVSLWTQLDQSLVTTGTYVVDLVAASTTAGVALEAGDQLILQAVHHSPAATIPVFTSEYLEQAFQYEGSSITSLATLKEAAILNTFANTQGQDGSQVVGITLDPSTPGKIQLDTSVTELSSADAALYFYYVRWASALHLLRNNLEVLGENEIKIVGPLTLDAAVPCVVSGPFTYRADGGFLQATESETISFQWRNLLGFTQVIEIPFNLSPEVLQGFQSLLAMTATILENQQTTSGSLTTGQATQLQQLHNTLESDGVFSALALANAPAGSGSGGASDWTAIEREQLRYRLGIDGSSSAPMTSNPALGTLSANVLQISGDSVAADNLEALLDGTGSVILSGSLSGSVGGVEGVTFPANFDALTVDLNPDQSGVTIGATTNLSNLPSVPANWLTGAGVAADAVTKIATGVETAIINEGDGQQVVQAFVDAINSQFDLSAAEELAVAGVVRTQLQPDFDALTTAINTRLAAADYTVPLSSIATQAAVANALTNYDAPTKTDITNSTNAIQANIGILLARLSADRATYLDALNVTGTLAHTGNASLFVASGFATPGDVQVTVEGSLGVDDRVTLEAILLASESFAKGRLLLDYPFGTQFTPAGEIYQEFIYYDADGNPATGPYDAFDRRPNP